MLKVLIVDDQPAVCTALELLFEVHGLQALAVHRPEDALDLIATEDIGAVVQDMNFTQQNTNGEEGVRLFHAIKKLDPDLPTILLTAWGSLETAVQLVKEGASDYMAKPWDDAKLVRTVQNLVQMRTLHQENTRIRAQSMRMRRTLAARYDLRGLVYASEQMHAVVNLAVTVAASDAPILITGANGSGKEKLAEIIQANSRRKDAAFVKVNAGALPDQLLEAELFGAEAGAFTGAAKMRMGRFEAAHGGTLFLDEIGNLSPAGQAKLLRVLQTGEFERLGSSGTRKVDVRIVSATNVDLPRAIAEGKFREDLFFRLNVIELHIPPITERPDDIMPLAEHFLATLPGQDGSPPPRLGDAARAALLQHEWNGNVRELQNRIHRAKLVCTEGMITPAHLGLTAGGVPLAAATRPAGQRTPGAGLAPLAPLGSPAAAPPLPARVPAAAFPGSGEGGGSPGPSSSSSSSTSPLPPGAVDPDRAVVEEALLKAGGVVSRAAAEMGLSRQALYRRMERVGIVLERRPKV
ncbi:MAG: sigma-54 dependent transcriptional regulator [Pseudomonadota bacterium]